jgi:Protein of unknown function (DUF3375)
MPQSDSSYLFETSPAVQAVRMRNAPWVIPFLFAVTRYQLSTHSEKLFQWLQSLEKKQFVGTDSRFRFLFQTLREMVEYTEDDCNRDAVYMTQTTAWRKN